MSSSEITFLSLEAEGPQVTPDDVEELRAAFGEFAPLRVWGAQAPAFLDAAMVGAAIGFFGGTLLQFLLSKGFDNVWEKAGRGWKRYRESRQRRGKREPTFDRVTLQAADCEVVVNGPPEPGSPELQEVMELLGSRLQDGLLSRERVATITLPCRSSASGEWEMSEFGAPSSSDNFYVWYIRAATGEDHSGYYDAREDAWLG